MKTVMKASEVIAAFIAQDQDNARTPYNRDGHSSIYFEKHKAFSYGSHYVIAELSVDGVAFVNGQGSSVTTNKHRHNLSYALREAGWKVITVDNISADTFDSHMANVKVMREHRESTEAKRARARSESMREHYSNAIVRSLNDSDIYLNWMRDNMSTFDSVQVA